MEVRGERECRACGAQWSYFETGSVTCPECGAVESVAVTDERTLHTDGNATLDLASARSHAGEDRLREAAREAMDAARSYVRERGFVDAGDLRTLDDRYLAALELRHVAHAVDRGLDTPDAVQRHFLALLRGAPEGERPAPEEVPSSLHGAHGLAAAAAVERYASELRDYLDATEDDSTARDLLDRLRPRVKRVQALDGEVPPAEAARLVTVARAVHDVVTAADDEAREAARETATDALAALG